MKLVKDTDELDAVAKELNKNGSYHWVCGPIETGRRAEDYIPKDAAVYTFILYEVPQQHRPGEAQYESISGSYYYLLPRPLEVKDLLLPDEVK